MLSTLRLLAIAGSIVLLSLVAFVAHAQPGRSLYQTCQYSNEERERRISELDRKIRLTDAQIRSSHDIVRDLVSEVQDVNRAYEISKWVMRATDVVSLSSGVLTVYKVLWIGEAFELFGLSLPQAASKFVGSFRIITMGATGYMLFKPDRATFLETAEQVHDIWMKNLAEGRIELTEKNLRFLYSSQCTRGECSPYSEVLINAWQDLNREHTQRVEQSADENKWYKADAFTHHSLKELRTVDMAYNIDVITFLKIQRSFLESMRQKLTDDGKQCLR